MSKRKDVNVLKIGGQLLEDSKKLSALLQNFAALEGLKILVHGGGKKASQLAEKLEIPVQMKAGRRLTDSAMLEVVTMVYAGFYNKNIVSQLAALSCPALGICGADLDIIRATKRPVREIDYGWVGDIEKINTQSLKQLLELNICPVFSAITHDGQGQLLNTNADTIAADIAIALAPFYQVDLRFCFEFSGVLSDPADPQSLIPSINPQQYSQLKKTGSISGGMIPKLDNAFRALQKQVSTISIGNFSGLFHQKGTQLCL